MRSLADCKEYFKDLYMGCLDKNAFEKAFFDSTERAMFETHRETLKFIYGEQFVRVEATWNQEALNEYYSALAET